jgi:chromosome segregation ATPase
MRRDFAGLRGEVTGLRGEVTELRGEVGGLRAEGGELRGQVADLRGEVTDLRGEVTGLRGEVTGLRGEVTHLHTHVGETAMEIRRHFDVTAEALRHDLQTVAEGVAMNNEKIDRLGTEIRAEMGSRFAAVHAAFVQVRRDIEELRASP